MRRWKLADMDQLPGYQEIEDAIHVIRSQRVMLDADLARRYGVQTERLNQQVQRNRARFPADFAFRLSPEEWEGMYLQFAGTLRRTRRSAHDAAISQLLDEIRRLTRFPESPGRQIGFTAAWRDET